MIVLVPNDVKLKLSEKLDTQRKPVYTVLYSTHRTGSLQLHVNVHLHVCS